VPDLGILTAAAVLTCVMVAWLQTAAVIRAIVLLSGWIDRLIVLTACLALNPEATARATRERHDRRSNKTTT
jgi:hypothetical protein